MRGNKRRSRAGRIRSGANEVLKYLIPCGILIPPLEIIVHMSVNLAAAASMPTERFVVPDLEDFMECGLSISQALEFWGYMTSLPKQRKENWGEEMAEWLFAKLYPVQGNA
jgi:hypothetical protein